MKKIIFTLIILLGPIISLAQFDNICLISEGCTGTDQFTEGLIYSPGGTSALTSTTSPTVDTINANNGTSSITQLNISSAITIVGEYITNFTTYVRGLFTGGDHVTITNGNISVDDDFLLNTGDTASGDYNFSSNTLFIDDSAGYVGVGTSTLDAKLNVVGTLGDTNNIATFATNTPDGIVNALAVKSDGTVEVGDPAGTGDVVNKLGGGLWWGYDSSEGSFVISSDNILGNNDALTLSTGGDLTVNSLATAGTTDAIAWDYLTGDLDGTSTDTINYTPPSGFEVIAWDLKIDDTSASTIFGEDLTGTNHESTLNYNYSTDTFTVTYGSAFDNTDDYKILVKLLKN